MAWRAYFSTILGTSGAPPTEAAPAGDSFRPALADLLPAGVHWKVLVYGRQSDTAVSAGAWALCLADVNATMHSALVADARITYLPIEDQFGIPLNPRDPISMASSGNRTTVQNAFEARHIPLQGLSLQDPVAKVFRYAVRRGRIRWWLGTLDFTEGFATTIGQIATTRRNNIRTRLTAAGYDVAVLTNSMTIRQAIAALWAQDVPLMRTPLDDDADAPEG